jgi:NADPH:quinone reductase-like Zn-dependent oxidoreductase
MGAKQSFPDHADGATMQAAAFASYGRTYLQLTTVPKPTPKPDDLLIKIHAAAINPIDKIRLEGGLKQVRPEYYATPILGYDASGVVEEVGADVTKFKVGDEVYVRIARNDGQGTIAEYCLAQEKMAALKPKNISFEEAASLPLVAVTAMQAFKRGGVKEGDKVVVTGGAGGVGSIAIQLAKHVLKCSHVLTTASAGEKMDMCLELGADAVADYKTQVFTDGSFGDDFDFGFDTTHESTAMPFILKENTKCVTISDTPTVEELERVSGKPVGFIVSTFLGMGLNKAAVANAATRNVEWSYLFLQPNGADLDALRGYVEDGLVKPVIDSIHPFSDFNAGVDRAFSGRAKGKVVIKMVE